MSWNLRPKFVSVYEKLFQSAPAQLTDIDQDQFWLDVFSLDLDIPWLSEKLHRLSQEDCLGPYKALLNILCRRSLLHLTNAPYDHIVKANSLETLIVFVRCILAKQLSGWEIMAIFAGGVGESDALFTTLTKTIDDILKDGQSPIKFKHRALQLSLVFICSVNQLSPGAYFLRTDLHPSLVSIILTLDTQQFTFEATLMISLLSNFHKSDAAKTNPVLNRIKESTDQELMTRINWVAAFAAQKAAAAYQDIKDDSPTLATTFGSLVASLRPDRALSATPVDPREVFKRQPIEAAVILLPLYDFLHYNNMFRELFRQSLTPHVDPSTTVQTRTQPKTPLPHAMLCLSSYLLTHASSTSSPRALAYAHLALTTFLVCVEDGDIVEALCQLPPPGYPEVRLCRQRPPYLPYSASPRPPICALLDCCVLWLRHNLHKRLDVLSYITCVRVLHRAVWFVAVEKLRIDYHWEELWRSLILALEFTANHVGALKSITKVDELAQDIICLIYFTVRFAARFLPSPGSLHQLVYELVRSAHTFEKQNALLKSLQLPISRRNPLSPRGLAELASLETITGYYQKKLSDSDAQTAKAVMNVLAQNVDQDGVHGVTEQEPLEELPPRYSDDDVDYSFVRWACADGLALMPE